LKWNVYFGQTTLGFKIQASMNKISNYFRDSYKELSEKVTWPTWEQLQQSTMIVLGATLLITALVWVMDFIAAGGLNFIYKLF
jgi:preprotein translocase subunit SecE